MENKPDGHRLQALDAKRMEERSTATPTRLISIWPNPVKVKWSPRLALDASGVVALERAFQLGHQSVWRGNRDRDSHGP
jgi:hypothetical protein